MADENAMADETFNKFLEKLTVAIAPLESFVKSLAPRGGISTQNLREFMVQFTESLAAKCDGWAKEVAKDDPVPAFNRGMVAAYNHLAKSLRELQKSATADTRDLQT